MNLLTLRNLSIMEHYFHTRGEFSDWLDENHSTSKEAWLIFFKKASGKKGIPYNDAVEVALCYGWIDGKIKSINSDYYIQRYSPRRKGSRWSKYNIERVRRMIEMNKMQPPGLLAFREVLDKPELVYDNRTDGNPAMPDDLQSALQANVKALENFTCFSESVRRIYIDWLNTAKRPETRERRIVKIVGLAEKNIRPGINTL
jgi:uncharacterized protein YdeI (YjbR/CyaY-like superfamily)